MAHAGSTQQISGVSANSGNAVPPSRTINTTAPLTGGGNLSADRTFALDPGAGVGGTGSITLAATDGWKTFVVAPNAARTFNLPSASLTAFPIGAFVTIVKTNATNSITVTPDGTDTVNGAASYALTAQYGCILVQKVSTTAWAVIATAGIASTAGLEGIAYVSASGNDGTAELDNIAKPYLTIAAAITAAAATGGAYTIMVGPGTFTENLTWAELLSLQGSGNLQTIISGTLTLTAGATAVANSLTFADVRITGNVVLNFSGKTSGTSLVEIHDCVLGAALTITQKTTNDYCNIYDTTVAGTTTENFANFWAVGCTFAAVSHTSPNGGEVLSLQACRAQSITFVGAGSHLRCTGCNMPAVTLALTDVAAGSGSISFDGCNMRTLTLTLTSGNLRTTGCDLIGGTFTLNGGTWNQNGCIFTNSGYLASAAPGTVDLSYWGGTVNVTAAATLTLPATAKAGYFLTVKNGNTVASGNNVTVARNGNSIDGTAADAVIGPLQSLTLIADGTNWWVI